jgi:heme A synthase
MRQSVVEHIILALVTLVSLAWLGLLPGRWFGIAALVLLGWGAASTLLVAMLGAWVALGKSKRRWHQPSL